MRSILALTVCISVTLSQAWLPLPSVTSTKPPPPKVSTDAWLTAAVYGSADIIVSAQGYPDLSAAQRLGSKQAKTRYVADALIRYADRSQQYLRRDLSIRHITYRVLWLTNSLAVSGASLETMVWLAGRSDVSRIDLDLKGLGLEAQSAKTGGQQVVTNRQSPTSGPHVPATISAGVLRINAPQVWALGYRGQGIVIADLDTGVQWDHPALQSHFRGWNGVTATFDANWFDPTGESVVIPSDDNGHGTHTTGTLIGDDGAGTVIGVAPGAQWIACRNMLLGTGSVSRYIACFQFALAPTDVNGNNPNPALAADITNNSWECWGEAPWYEQGCLQPDALLTATLALRSAGIMVVAAAGNEGSNCLTVSHAPGMYQNVFTVGATNLDDSNSIASFSSQGPSTFDGSLKPDLVAPGVSIYSSWPISTYYYDSGTSMSTPHVAGTVALMWSAAPGLRGDIADTENILRETAVPLTSTQNCGGVIGSLIPNNTYGYGLVDAQAAVSASLRGMLVATPAAMLSSLSDPITYTVTLTNYTTMTRTGTIRLTLPSGTTLSSTSPAAVQHGASLAWAFDSLAPLGNLQVILVVRPIQTGVVTLGDYEVNYSDGHTASQSGSPVSTFVYIQKLWLINVMRN